MVALPGNVVKEVTCVVELDGWREERKITAYLRPSMEEQDFHELAEQILKSY